MHNTDQNTLGSRIKKLAAAAVLAAVLAGLAVAANAATNIVNWCTSTYSIPGVAMRASGPDIAIVQQLWSPIMQVTKYAKNERTGLESTDQIVAVSGDTILFTIVWQNIGEAPADSITLNDYVPAGMTYIAGSVTDTEANTAGAATENSGLIQWVNNAGTDVPGTIPGPAADGVIKFRAVVN